MGKPNERFISEDAVALIAMLPAGLTDEWQEKAFNVMCRTKAEIAAPEMLEVLNQLTNCIQSSNNGCTTLIVPMDLSDRIAKLLNKVTK